MGRLDGKHALITGGAKGIGEAAARAFVAEGAAVIIADIDDKTGEAVAASIGDQAIYQHLDVTRAEDWDSAVARIQDRFGQLEVLVNNAGGGIMGGVEDTTLEQFRWVHAFNVDSIFLGMKACLPLLKRSGNASIINVSSIAGMLGAPNMLAYCSAKGAVRILTKSAAMDFTRRKYGIRCNSVHPAFTATPLVNTMIDASGDPDRMRGALEREIPMRRLGRPEEIASMLLYLASDESSFVTGAEMVVDGGTTAQ